jgi:hypothetical protein
MEVLQKGGTHKAYDYGLGRFEGGKRTRIILLTPIWRLLPLALVIISAVGI